MELKAPRTERSTSPVDLAQTWSKRYALDDSLLLLHINRVERAHGESPSEIGPGGCLGLACTGVCMNQMRELATSIRTVHNLNFGKRQNLGTISLNGYTSLMWYAEHRQKCIVQNLLRLGVDINAKKNNSSETVATCAVKGGHPDIVKTVLDRGFDLKAIENEDLLETAVEAEHCDVVAMLLARGATIDSYHLRIAAEKGNVRLVKLLLNQLEKSESVDIIKAVLDRDPDLTALEYETPLGVAVKAGHAEIVDMLLAIGATPDPYDLRVAAKKGNLRIVESLFNKLSKIKSRESLLDRPIYRKRAIGQAAKKGHTDVVRLLLDWGADPNIRDGNGRQNNMNPLLFAAKHGHSDTVRLLCKRGANPYAYLRNRDYDRRGPYDVAKANGHDAVLKVLQGFGVGSIYPNSDSEDD